MNSKNKFKGEKYLFSYSSVKQCENVHEAIGCGQKSFKLVWRCHQLLFGFLAKGHLLRESHRSCLSADDMGDNEMIAGAVYRSPYICLTTEENPGKPQLGDHR